MTDKVLGLPCVLGRNKVKQAAPARHIGKDGHPTRERASESLFAKNSKASVTLFH